MLCPPLPDRSQWRSEYINDDFYEKLKHYKSEIIKQIELHSHDYKNIAVSFSSHYQNLSRMEAIIYDLTPRAIECLMKEVILDSFYIVDYIRKNSTGTIYDIGCGSNAFKYFFNDIIGIDAANTMADIKCQFDSEYIGNNKDKLSNAIAINSLHYGQSFQKFKQVVENFGQVISPGGYGYITFNIFFMVQATEKEKNNIPEDIHQFILDRLSETALHIIDVQFVDATVNGDNGLDGNIRILFRK